MRAGKNPYAHTANPLFVIGTEDYPCERTMQRWSEWIRRNTTQIDGFLRSICRRLSDPGKEHLDPALDRDKKIQMRKDLAARNDLSEKTLRRYESSYQEKGFAGLKPAERVRRARIPEELFQTFLQAKSDDADSGRYQIRSEASHRSRRKACSEPVMDTGWLVFLSNLYTELSDSV